MGSGSSGVGGGGGSKATAPATTPKDFKEAFAPGKDFVAVGGANHDTRSVSRMTQAEWDAYASQFGSDPSSSDVDSMMKTWDPRYDNLYGYFRTTNSMALNKKFYESVGKSPDEIFKGGKDAKSRKQNQKDLETVNTLDKVISSHSTPADGLYYRFCTPESLQKSYGLSDAQINLIKQAPTMNASQLKQLNTALKGSKASSPGYTSVSANRSLNAFSNPSAKQSKGYIIERRMNVPKGTKAYAPKRNAQESEVIFGRNFGVGFSHLAVEGNHIVIYENH